MAVTTWKAGKSTKQTPPPPPSTTMMMMQVLSAARTVTAELTSGVLTVKRMRVLRKLTYAGYRSRGRDRYLRYTPMNTRKYYDPSISPVSAQP
jgi:hypothetical protein